jgi:hypothetical protein
MPYRDKPTARRRESRRIITRGRTSTIRGVRAEETMQRRLARNNRRAARPRPSERLDQESRQPQDRIQRLHRTTGERQEHYERDVRKAARRGRPSRMGRVTGEAPRIGRPRRAKAAKTGQLQNRPR